MCDAAAQPGSPRRRGRPPRRARYPPATAATSLRPGGSRSATPWCLRLPSDLRRRHEQAREPVLSCLEGRFLPALRWRRLLPRLHRRGTRNDSGHRQRDSSAEVLTGLQHSGGTPVAVSYTHLRAHETGSGTCNDSGHRQRDSSADVLTGCQYSGGTPMDERMALLLKPSAGARTVSG